VEKRRALAGCGGRGSFGLHEPNGPVVAIVLTSKGALTGCVVRARVLRVRGVLRDPGAAGALARGGGVVVGGQHPKSDSVSGVLRVFGGQLKLLRERAGLGRAEFGNLTGYSASTIASYEQGRRIASPEFVEKADEVLGAGGVLVAAVDELGRQRFPAFFRDFAILEAEALSLSLYECMAIPGLLQTEAFARAVFSGSCPPLSDEEIDQRVAARLARQTLLDRVPPVVLSVVMEEDVLRRLVGGAAVMKGQIQRLCECARMRNITLQVMPTRSDSHPGMAGPLVLIETADHRHLAYLEAQRSSLLISEPDDVSVLTQRFGIIRARALTTAESLRLMEQVAGEL
jgi:transcriptional regulator with XRE-family HTH domain